MKNLFLVSLFLMSAKTNILAQDSRPCLASELPVKWVQTGQKEIHSNHGPTMENFKMIANYNPAKMRPTLQKALDWLKKKTEGISSHLAEYQLNFQYGDPQTESLKENFWYQDTKVLGYYYLWVMANARRCYTKDGKLQSYYLDAPADISIYFNRTEQHAVPVRKLLGSKVIPFKIKGRSVYILPEYKKTVGRIDAYEFPGPVPPTTASYSRILFTNTYIIRNSDKKLFITVKRKEFFEQYLAEMPLQYAEEIKWAKDANVKTPEQIDEERKQRIAEIKRLTAQGAYGYSQSDLEFRLKKAEEFYSEMKKTEANLINNKLKLLEEEYQESIRLVKEYLKKPDSILDKSINLEDVHIQIHPSGIKKMFQRMDERYWLDQTELAFVNPDYFNPKLTPDVPQFICIEMINLDNRHTHFQQLTARFNTDYDFAGLEALFPNGNNTAPIVQQPVSTKKGTAAFLPKLKQLPALPYALPPVKNQQGMDVFTNIQSPGFNSGPIQIKFPLRSSLLNSIPLLVTETDYKNAMASLLQSIIRSIPEKDKTALDDYCVKNKIISSEQFARNGLGAWFNKKPIASLYLHSKAVTSNTSDGLSANNLAALLIKSGYPEKAIPILQYWLKKYPKNELLLNNLGDAYYYLGDADKAMQYARQCIASDSLHPGANKLLAYGHYKKGEKGQCISALKRSIKSSYDPETIALLLQLEPSINISRLLYEGRAGAFEPRIINRFQLPTPINSNETAEEQLKNIIRVKESLNITIENIRSKRRPVDAGAHAGQFIKTLQKIQGIPSMQIQGQAIVFESLHAYNKDFSENYQYLKERLNATQIKYNRDAGIITKTYNDKMSKIEGGEAGNEDEYMRLMLARCNELNSVLNEYLETSASYINQHAGRLEYISRKHYSTYAQWAPHWLQSDSAADFPGTQIDYLLSMKSILDLYPLDQPSDCSIFEIEEEDSTMGELMVWEEKFCPVKLSLGMGPVKLGMNCNTFSIGGGEGVVGELEVKLNENWDQIDEVTASGGIGTTWNLGTSNIAKIEAGAASKVYIKTVRNKASGKWELNDVGTKNEATVSGTAGTVEAELKMVEITVGINSGVSAEGVIPKIIELR